MSRRQLPPQIKKVEVLDRKSSKTVVRYQLTVDAGISSETGKRQQVRRRYATEKQASDALAEITQQVSSDAFVPRKTVTVEDLCADWIASLHNARATTVNAYRFSLAPLRERHGDLPAQKLTRPDLDKLLIALRDGGTATAKGKPRRAWSARSLNKAVDAWRMMLAYRNGHLWYLALSGLRRGEIARLKWSDIDFAAGAITIARNRVQAGAANVVENEPKTLSSCRTLPLDEGLVAVLKRASARYAEEKLALGEAYADSGYVAVNEAGEPYSPDSLTRMWHKLAESAGVRPIRLHDARHSCGTALHLRGVPLAVIAKWLGHADAAITAKIYAHSQDDALKAAGQSLGAVVTSS